MCVRTIIGATSVLLMMTVVDGVQQDDRCACARSCVGCKRAFSAVDDSVIGAL